MFHLANVISISKKTFVPLPLFLNLSTSHFLQSQQWQLLWILPSTYSLTFLKAIPTWGSFLTSQKHSILPFPRRSWKSSIFDPTHKYKFPSVLSYHASFCSMYCCYSWFPAWGLCLLFKLLAFRLGKVCWFGSWTVSNLELIFSKIEITVCIFIVFLWEECTQKVRVYCPAS